MFRFGSFAETEGGRRGGVGMGGGGPFAFVVALPNNFLLGLTGRLHDALAPILSFAHFAL